MSRFHIMYLSHEHVNASIELREFPRVYYTVLQDVIHVIQLIARNHRLYDNM